MSREIHKLRHNMTIPRDVVADFAYVETLKKSVVASFVEEIWNRKLMRLDTHRRIGTSYLDIIFSLDVLEPRE